MFRCNVGEVSTKDFVTYSDVIFLINGSEQGHVGLCSPNVTPHFNATTRVTTYYVTFNSWSGPAPARDQLYFMSSTDLRHWSNVTALAPDLTRGDNVIDAAVAWSQPLRRWVLFYKSEVDHSPRVAVSVSPDTNLAAPFRKLSGAALLYRAQ